MNFSLLKESSSVFNEATPLEVSGYVNVHIGNHGLSLLESGGGGASLSHRKVGGLDLCRIAYGTRARVVSEGLPETYHVQFILNGQCHYHIGPDQLVLQAGEVMVINPDEPIDLTYSPDCEKFILCVSDKLFDQACSEHCRLKSGERVRFTPVPYRFEELNGMLNLLQLLCEEAESANATPQLLQHYTRVITSKLIAVLKHNIDLAPPSLHNPCFVKLVQYIEDNIKRDITPEELARHANLSLRSLYLLFDKHARATPKNFVRQKKLEHVYATLINPLAKGANVTAVALEYGFSHLGRFSEFYKAAFGVLPSETLRARQSGQ